MDLNQANELDEIIGLVADIKHNARMVSSSLKDDLNSLNNLNDQ